MATFSRRLLWVFMLLGGLLSALAVGLADGRTQSLILHTAVLVGATCGLSLPAGTLLGWLLVRTDLPGRRAGLLVLGVLVLVPLYLQAAAWQAGFGVQGWYTRLAGAALVDGWRGAIWVHTMAAIPWVVLIVGGGLWLVEPELEQQALLDGSPGQVLMRVTLRGAIPALGVAALWVAIVTAGQITVTDLFIVRTYAEELYTRIAVGPQPGETPLGVWPGVAVTAWLVLAGLLLCARLAPSDRPPSAGGRWVYRLGAWRWPSALVALLVLIALAGIPLGSLVYKAGATVAVADGNVVRNWSAWRSMSVVVTSPMSNSREFGWSLGIGFLAATAATAAGIVLAWPARRGGYRALPALLVAAVCLATPKPVVGLAVIKLLNQPGGGPLTWLYDHSILAPWLVLTVVGLPPAVLILWHAFRTVPSEMLDSAATDGAGSVGQLLRIGLPCRVPAILLAWVVAMAAALGELGASILVVPPGVTTLSIKIFSLLHGGVSEFEVAGICLALVVLFAAAAVAVALLARIWGRAGSIR